MTRGREGRGAVFAFNAKETHHDDTIDDPVPVTGEQATVVVRFE